MKCGTQTSKEQTKYAQRVCNVHIAYKGTQTLVLASLCPIRSIGLKEDKRTFSILKVSAFFPKNCTKEMVAYTCVFRILRSADICVFCSSCSMSCSMTERNTQKQLNYCTGLCQPL